MGRLSAVASGAIFCFGRRLWLCERGLGAAPPPGLNSPTSASFPAGRSQASGFSTPFGRVEDAIAAWLLRVRDRHDFGRFHRMLARGPAVSKALFDGGSRRSKRVGRMAPRSARRPMLAVS